MRSDSVSQITPSLPRQTFTYFDLLRNSVTNIPKLGGQPIPF